MHSELHPLEKMPVPMQDLEEGKTGCLCSVGVFGGRRHPSEAIGINLSRCYNTDGNARYRVRPMTSLTERDSHL